MESVELVQSGTTAAYRTLNNMGFMFDLQDEYVTSFIEYAATADGPIADLGCAAGVITRRILQAGAKHVIANDLYEGHLTVLYDALTDDERRRIQLLPGSALEIGREIPDGSLAGILAANLVLFFQPKEIRELFKMFFRLLKPNGKLCIVTSNTHNKFFKNWPRIPQTMAGKDDEWPGLVGDDTDSCLNLMDPNILEREAKMARFNVEKVGFIDMGAVFEPFGSLDGQGSGSGLLAVKPN